MRTTMLGQSYVLAPDLTPEEVLGHELIPIAVSRNALSNLAASVDLFIRREKRHPGRVSSLVREMQALLEGLREIQDVTFKG